MFPILLTAGTLSVQRCRRPCGHFSSWFQRTAARFCRGSEKSTKSLMSHLRSRRRPQRRIKRNTKRQQLSECSTAYASAYSTGIWKKCRTYSEDNPKAKAITDNTDFTALDDGLFLPWSMTRGSRGIMAHLEPRCSPLSCRYAADVSLPCTTRSLRTLVV